MFALHRGKYAGSYRERQESGWSRLRQPRCGPLPHPKPAIASCLSTWNVGGHYTHSILTKQRPICPVSSNLGDSSHKAAFLFSLNFWLCGFLNRRDWLKHSLVIDGDPLRDRKSVV